MYRPKAVIFDLGSVLIDIDFNRCFEFWAKVSCQSAAHIKSLFKFDGAYAAHEISTLSSNDYHKHVCKLLDFEMTFDEFSYGWNDIFLGLISETWSLVKDVKRHSKVYVFSNSNPLHRKVWASKYKQELSLFDDVFCSSLIGARKPNGPSYLKVLDQIKCKPSEAIFLDDLLENIEGAKSAGLRAYQFDRTFSALNDVRAEFGIPLMNYNK
jgi:glucose-1-phosphatase